LALTLNFNCFKREKVMKKLYVIFSFVIVLFVFQACKKGLNYQNNNAINSSDVWTNADMIKAFLTDIYGAMMPGWPYNGNSTDEGISNPKDLGNYQRGITSVALTGQNLDYKNIDKLNFFLSKLPAVPSSVLSSDQKQQLKGQAFFWRAWDYFGKVATFGGVPLILRPQDVTKRDSLFVPRNKTSECMAQITTDLDSAIADLPDQWDDADYGRITKGAAMAFKGKVALWYASPLFNSTDDRSRWQNAYNVNKQAVDYLKAQGYGLVPNFRDIWYQERNKGVIMVNQFYYPDHAFFQGPIRPEVVTKDASNHNQLLLPLLLAFPQKDGSPLQLDTTKLKTDPAYNAQFLTDFYTNRDDRFYATVWCGGTVYPTPDIPAPTRLWYCWRRNPDPTGTKYLSLAEDQLASGANFGCSGFFDRKGLDTTLTSANVYNAGVDWPEIRFAEVLMDYGEAANEVGKSAEALNVLYQIRARAGINPGTGNTYGITATSQPDIREAYIRERFVEFAFENKRSGDLRRWKRYDILNNEGHRHGLYVVIKPGETIDWTDDIMTAGVRQKFKAVYIDNLDGDPDYKFNLNTTHWFYPISQSNIDADSKLEQNIGWGGTFDPLQ
jgi:hypothetical protein